MENIYLTGAAGTQWNVGSWLEKTAGPVDYGAHDLIRQQLTQAAFVEGAQLGYETAAGPRKMSFPLIVASGGITGLSLDTIEAAMRQMVRPGGYVDLQPQGVATAERVRFDILGGDVSHRDYSVDVQRVARRRYTLSLLTQPYGYWPTQIVLASVASIGFPMKLAIPAAAVIGDAPGWATLRIDPYHATQWGAGGTYVPDFVAWSAGGKASFNAFLHPASWVYLGLGSIGGDANAPASQYAGAYLSPTLNWTLTNQFNYTIPSSMAAVYAGRYRFFAFANLGPSTPAPFFAIGDNVPVSAGAVVVATGNPIATMPPSLSPTANATWNAIGSGYTLLDLGEISIPRFAQAGSYLGPETLRITFGNSPSFQGSVPSGGAFLKLGGAWLMPLDTPGGFLTRGLAQPTIFGAQPAYGALALNSRTRDNLVLGTLDTKNSPLQDNSNSGVAAFGWNFYRGGLPYVSATNAQLNVLVGVRQVGGVNSDPAAVGPGTRAGIALTYTPRFQFLRGL